MSGTTYRASCGCGNISYDYTTAVAPEDWNVRTCNCAFCSQRPGHIHCADPNGSLRFSIADPDAVNRLRHGTRTADFIICAKCDGYMGAVMETEQGRFAVVNLQHLEDDLPLGQGSPIAQAGEDLETRMARRHKNWMPVIGDV